MNSLVVCQILSSCNFPWTAEFAQRENSNILWEYLAVVRRFEQARSHDVNDPTPLINLDFKYLQQNHIIVPVKSSAYSLVIFQVQI